MHITDLTHLIHSDMPVFPGTEQPVFEKGNTLADDGFTESRITMYSHTGTHIDAPFHLLEQGPCLDEMEIDRFIGKALILNFSNGEEKIIGLDSLKIHEEKIRNAEFLILKTGWEIYWGDKRYFEDFPSLSLEAAEWLSAFNLKGVGIDAISIDPIESESFAIHKIFLRKNTIIIENLSNLNSVSSEYFILSILPLKNRSADGSPVRAVAINGSLTT